MKFFIRLYYKLFPTYRRLEVKLFAYSDADKLIRENAGKPKHEQWVLAKEEDNHVVNVFAPTVWLERRERIYG